MAKKIFKVLGILLVLLIVLVVIIIKWSDATVGAMTEPIRQEFAAPNSNKFRISKSIYGETEGTAIVTITNTGGQTHEEKYFLKKSGEIWSIDKKEPYVTPTSTQSDSSGAPKNQETSANKSIITAVMVVDGSEVEPKKDGDTYVINERNRYFGRISLAQPLTKTTSFKHSYKKTSSGFMRGFTTEALFPKNPPIGVLYVELKPKDGNFGPGTYESTVTVGDDSAVIKYRVE